MDNTKDGKMYTQEELKKIKKDYSHEQKMDFMMDMINDNSQAIKDIRDTLHNGWDRQIWYNTMWRKGSLWFFGAIIVAGLGYVITLI